jgi:hypothetical protein
MKLATSALLLLLTAAASLAETKVTFDKFKNTTHFITSETQTSKVTLSGGKDASILIHRMGMVTAFGCQGQVESCIPLGIELLFVAHTSDWVMNERNEVNFLIDGRPEAAGKASWDGQVLEAEDLVEYNDVFVSQTLLARLASARSVDVQIGAFEFSLTDTNLSSLRDAATHAGWMPEGFKKGIIENGEASKASPAAAAQLAQDGHVMGQREGADLVQKGQASRTAVITIPPGADVYVDGNKAGATPLVFVLIKRDAPRVITIKLTGYKTVEKTFVPDGISIPIGLTLEKEQ